MGQIELHLISELDRFYIIYKVACKSSAHDANYLVVSKPARICNVVLNSRRTEASAKLQVIGCVILPTSLMWVSRAFANPRPRDHMNSFRLDAVRMN